MFETTTSAENALRGIAAKGCAPAAGCFGEKTAIDLTRRRAGRNIDALCTEWESVSQRFALAALAETKRPR